MSETENDSKKKASKRLRIESIAIFLIIATPFLYKLHMYVSQDPGATLTILGYTIDNNGFGDLSTYVWFLLSKIIPIYLLAIWFFTCKHWWYHVILIPLCMYAFQLFEVIYSESNVIETENILWLLPVCMAVITFVYFIRIKLYDKYVHGIDLDAMDAELEYYRQKEHQKQVRINRKVESNAPSEEIDTPEQGTKKTFFERFTQFQHSFKNLFNFF